MAMFEFVTTWTMITKSRQRASPFNIHDIGKTGTPCITIKLNVSFISRDWKSLLFHSGLC